MYHKNWYVLLKPHQQYSTLQTDEVLCKVCPAVGSFFESVGVAKIFTAPRQNLHWIYIYSRLYLCVRSGNTSSSRQKVLHLTQCWCTWIPLLFSTEKNDVSFFWLVLVTLKPLWKTVAPEQIPIAHSLIKMSICAIFQFWSAVIREKHLLVEYKKRLAFHFFFQSFAK